MYKAAIRSLVQPFYRGHDGTLWSERWQVKRFWSYGFYSILFFSERGLIFTVHGDSGTRYAHIRHLPIMPYYENYRGAVPGISFDVSYMHFQSVDVDYRTKKIFLYDSYYRSVSPSSSFIFNHPRYRSWRHHLVIVVDVITSLSKLTSPS